jgi:elongation factor G
MEYCRYSPCLPDVQNKLIDEYERSMGIVPEKDKKKKKN